MIAVIRMVMKSLTFTEGLLQGQELWESLYMLSHSVSISQIPSLIPHHRTDV